MREGSPDLKINKYFQKLLNVPGDIEPEVLENIQKRSVNTAMDEKPTMDEMVRAIKGLKDGKAPGGDGIPTEVWKYGGANLSNRLHRWIIKYDKKAMYHMIFCLRQLQKKFIEQDLPLYIVFVDFTKAFDTVGRTGLWQLLRNYGCPEKFTTMIESLHNGIMVNVRNGEEISDTFAIINGIKQGCVLAPTLFTIFLSAMLEEAFRDMGAEYTCNHAIMQIYLQLHTSERRQKPQIYL